MLPPPDPAESELPAMAGHGFYNVHSPQQSEVADILLGVLQRALASLPASERARTIADYGASQGANSMRPIGEIITALRAHGHAPITVVHTDLPGNDWATLFATIYEAPSSYLVGATNVYPHAVGRSFYHQLLADGTVAAGWSSTAVLWLSARPDVGPGNLFSQLADADDHRRWADAAASDWRTFLRHRQTELAPGGRLVVSALMDDGSDRYLPFLELIRSGVEDAVAGGHVTAEEAGAMTVATYLRTRDEIEAPLRDGSMDLVILEHSQAVAADPAHEGFLQHGDPTRFAADEVAQIRGWAQPSLEAGLDAGRTAQQRATASAALFECIGARVAADPEHGHCDWAISALAVGAPDGPA